MSSAFGRLILGFGETTYDEFVADFGGIDREVSDMLTSPVAQKARKAARAWIDSNQDLLRRPKFGDSMRRRNCWPAKWLQLTGPMPCH
jgi:hypothetical protein